MWAVGSYSSGPPAGGTFVLMSTEYRNQGDVSPCSSFYLRRGRRSIGRTFHLHNLHHPEEAVTKSLLRQMVCRRRHTICLLRQCCLNLDCLNLDTHVLFPLDWIIQNTGREEVIATAAWRSTGVLQNQNKLARVAQRYGKRRRVVTNFIVTLNNLYFLPH